MADSKEALIITDCDPLCKWKGAVVTAGIQENVRKMEVAAIGYEGPDQPLYDEAGHQALRQIEEDYTGLDLLVSMARHCTRACVIERATDPETGHTFGAEVTLAMANLRGN